MIISFWNIRGLNQPTKQSEVAKFIFENNIDVLGLVETKVKLGNEDSIKSKVFKHWSSVTNSSPDSTGRIWIGWNPDKILLNVIKISPQTIYVLIDSIDKSFKSEATFVYGYNTGPERVALWHDLRAIQLGSTSTNYIALGDFNVVLHPNEKLGDNNGLDSDISDFQQAVNINCLVDLRYVGEFFTWCNRRYGRTDFTQRKLDRVLVNQLWLDNFTCSYAHFHSPGYL